MKKTDMMAQVKQMNGYRYERRVYTDGIRNHIKVNREYMDLYDFEKMSFIESINTYYSPAGR